MYGRLNVFQRVMYQWSGLHPYNAGQVSRLAGAFRRAELEAALRQTGQLHGFGLVEVSPAGRWYRYEPSSAFELEVIEADGDPEGRLAQYITRELNRAFDRPRCRPWRFFVVDNSPRDHFVGIMYDHWAADSVAVRTILRHVVGRYCGLDLPENRRPMDLYPPTYRRAFGSWFDGLRWLGSLMGTARLMAQLRRVYRVAYRSTPDMSAHFDWHRLPAETAPRLRAFARSVGVTVHDVFLAALARALARHLPRGAHRRKRRNLALGTIVDTRRDAPHLKPDALGMFLAYYVVQCPASGRRLSLADLAGRIGAATARIKAGRRYLETLVHMKLGSLIWPLLSERARPYFLRETLTLTAGISNVSLRDTWIARHAAGRILDHIRIAPTGPLLPLVLTPTTLADRMSLGVTYRTTAFSRQRIRDIVSDFLTQIEERR